MWITIDPNISHLSSSTNHYLKNAVKVVRTHSQAFWAYDFKETYTIRLGKLDIAIDLEGAFLTEDFKRAKDAVKKKLKEHIPLILSKNKSNCISSSALGHIKVVQGDNLLDSCL